MGGPFFLGIQLVPIFWVPNGWVVHFLPLNSVSTHFLGYQMGGPLLFFPNFSWYRVPKGVVPSDFFQISVGTGYQKGWSPLIFFQISVGTRYQNGWVVHFFLQIQLVPTFGYGLLPNILTPPLVYDIIYCHLNTIDLTTI